MLGVLEDRMRSELTWTIVMSSVATILAGLLMWLVVPMTLVTLSGWLVFIALLQLPLIAQARRGRLDPCTAWFRRVLTPDT